MLSFSQYKTLSNHLTSALIMVVSSQSNFLLGSQENVIKSFISAIQINISTYGICGRIVTTNISPSPPVASEMIRSFISAQVNGTVSNLDNAIVNLTWSISSVYRMAPRISFICHYRLLQLGPNLSPMITFQQTFCIPV